MPMRIGWYLRDHVLMCQLRGRVNWSEVQEAETFIIDLLVNAAHPLHLITDGTALTGLPPITQLRNANLPRQPMLGTLMLIGWQSSLSRYLMDKLLKQMPVHSRICRSLADATHYLQAQDPKMPTPRADTTIYWLTVIDHSQRQQAFS